jgi:hypothetical protein
MTTLFSTPRTVETSRGPGLWLGIIDRGPDFPILALVEHKNRDITVEALEAVKGAGVYQDTPPEMKTVGR